MKIKLITKKNRVGNIRLLLSYHCKSRRLFTTGVVIPWSDFQPESLEKPVRKSNPKADHYNRQVSLLYHELQQIISTLRREDKVASADLVYQLHNQKRNIEVESKNKRPFTSIFEQFVDEKAFSAATKKLYQNLHDQLLEWCSSVCLEEFDLRQWTEFRNFLKHEKKHSTNTICIRLNKLKAMIKYLKSTGHKIPLLSFPLPQEEIKKVFLDLKDLERVVDYIPLTAAMVEVKDLFLFQCYTALRVSDLKRLSVIHLKKFEEINFISMAAYKTNKPIMIPLNDVAWNILEKYKFVLPSITEQHYNREIKKLLRLAGVSTTFEWQTYDDDGRKIFKSKFLYEIFTNHCCSRTAIKYFFSRGYTPDQVARIVGKSLDTIMGYYYEEALEGLEAEEIPSPAVRTAMFVKNHPIAALGIGVKAIGGGFTVDAVRFSTRGTSQASGSVLKEPSNMEHQGTEVNAMRHTLWQATITRYYGADIANEIGQAHENNPNAIDAGLTEGANFGNRDMADEAVDLANNILGRAIGEANPEMGMRDLALKTLETFRNDGLWTATRQKDGTFTVNRTKITEDQYKTLKGVYEKLNNQGMTEAEQKAYLETFKLSNPNVR